MIVQLLEAIKKLLEQLWALLLGRIDKVHLNWLVPAMGSTFRCSK